MAQRQVVKGNFQDCLGNPLALGYLTWRLNTDAVTGTNVQVTAGRVLNVPLDSFGNVLGTVAIWPNDQLTPSSTVYIVKAYTAQGQLAWTNPTFSLPSGAGSYSLGG